jgi:hypothetical protein
MGLLLGGKPRNFSQKFAQGYCAVEASKFLPHPRGKVDFQKRACSGCRSRSDKLTVQMKAASQGAATS